MEAQLVRTYYSDATMGKFVLFEGKNILFTCHILELPWKSNQSNISCIPLGEYQVMPHTSEKFKKCFLVNGVTGRTAILIHSGNTTKDTHGCLLPGRKKGSNEIMGGTSRNALNKMLAAAPNGFKLTISAVFNDDVQKLLANYA